MESKNIGFTIGKFAPLHKGHQYLIETAMKEMDEFYIVIYETDKIKIPIEERANWIKNLYPEAKIIYAKNPPSKYGLDEESVNIQTNYLKKIIGEIPVTHFYSSEEYGKYVAEKMNIQDRRIDNKRNVVPICATKIRENPELYKNYLDESIVSKYNI